MAKVIWANIHNKEEISQNRDQWKLNIYINSLSLQNLNHGKNSRWKNDDLSTSYH